MGRKAKISYEIKFKFIEKYLNGNISQIGIARELGYILVVFRDGYVNIKPSARKD